MSEPVPRPWDLLAWAVLSVACGPPDAAVQGAAPAIASGKPDSDAQITGLTDTAALPETAAVFDATPLVPDATMTDQTGADVVVVDTGADTAKPADTPVPVDLAAPDPGCVPPAVVAFGADVTADIGGTGPAADPPQCAPCVTDSDCQDPASLAPLQCTTHPTGQRFCLRPCTANGDCPQGTACLGGACWPWDGYCGCSDWVFTAKSEPLCSIQTAAGQCVGLYACKQDIVPLCTAKTPVPEVCNGTDDDCDGKTDEGSLCDDGNPCTLDGCAAKCAHTAAVGLCDDGSACTASDHCQDSACTGKAIVCDDGLACTADKCVAGKCAHLPGACPCAVAAQCDDGTPCSTDLCVVGTCQHPASGATDCSDGNPCTVGDACALGACKPLGPAHWETTGIGGAQAHCNAVGVLPDGSVLAAGPYDKNASWLWRSGPNGKKLWTVDVKATVHALAVEGNGSFVAAGGAEGTWAASRGWYARFGANGAPVFQVVMAPSGTWLTSVWPRPKGGYLAAGVQQLQLGLVIWFANSGQLLASAQVAKAGPARAISASSADSIWVAGETFNPFASDAWVARIDASGKVLGQASHGFGSTSVTVQGIVALPDGGAVVLVNAFWHPQTWLVRIACNGAMTATVSLGTRSLLALQPKPGGGFLLAGTQGMVGDPGVAEILTVTDALAVASHATLATGALRAIAAAMGGDIVVAGGLAGSGAWVRRSAASGLMTCGQ